MPQMMPDLSDGQLNSIPSKAEVKVYKALRESLPKEYVVFFQVGWILRKEEQQARDGETDFLVCHPKHGFLCIEVKGGGIGFEPDSGQWFSIDRNQQRHEIKNPIEQSLKAKYSILSKLNEHPKWKRLNLRNILRGHSVFFPDIGNSSSIIRPDLPSSLIGTSSDLSHIREWVEEAFEYWGRDVGNFAPIDNHGVNVFKEVFARPIEVKPLLASRLEEQETKRLQLTSDQARVLDFLQSRRRVAVSGGAGTGKTLLALEKARKLASQGFNTLLTCYNRQLADHLSNLCADIENLDVMSFHQLCRRKVDQAKRLSARDLISEAKTTYPGTDFFDIQLPNALTFSLEILPERYDAIVCDEGQDFREEYWVPLELMLDDIDQSPLYVFFDDNQNIYSRASTFPISDEPFTLTTNCRNTIPIHNAAYKHYKGVHVSPPQNEGEDLQFEEAVGIKAQGDKISSVIVELISHQGVAPGDITVLIADGFNKNEYYETLKKHSLPKPASWLIEGQREQQSILLDTIQRFKGLESQVTILWGLDNIDLVAHEELLYVGMTRAKSLLILVASKATCHHVSQ